MAVLPNLSAQYQFRPHCTGHNIGRWWNALLRLQACTGFDIPPEVEAAMLYNTWSMSDNPTGIFLEEPDPSDVSSWYIHSYRETMLALGLLVKFRSSKRAHQQGIKAVAQMRKASRDLKQWDISHCDPTLTDLKPTGRGGEPAYTHGRAIEGLLCFYEATRSTEVLEEAERLADFHFHNIISLDGTLAEGCGHHTHSYLNTVRGLLLLARLSRQEDRLAAIHKTYKNAISGMITGSGFVTHDIGASLGGDIASAGDIAHIALLLWDHSKDPILLEDAENIVRSRLLPALVTKPMPLEPMETDELDCNQGLPERFVGAIGGAVGHVGGQTCVTDFTASALHSLIELYERTVDIEDNSIRVNFHFNYKRSGVQVISKRENSEAHLTVLNETGKSVYLRIPSWAPKSSLWLTQDGKQIGVKTSDGYACISKEPASIELRYALPESTTEETWRDETATQESVSFRWRGDQIYEVDPVGQYFKQFPKECRPFS
ncbi:MAG TPA: hypothetical protein DIU35_02505 [Candidatus Latescibacteria bacterium]|nr:hypothetical protein [Candidatus Latescibacterota bacterium]